MKETMLDKCIKINFRMVGSEIGIASVMGLLMVFFMSTFWLMIVMFVPIIVTVVYIVKMYKKLFYTSVYGETAAMYQSLPATAAEMTAAKIFTAAAGNIIITAVYIAATFMAIAFFAGAEGLRVLALAFLTGTDGIAETMPDIMQNLTAGDGITMLLTFINLVLSAFWMPALIFFAISVSRSSPGKKRKGLHNFFIIVGVYAVSLLVNNMGSFLLRAGVENLLIINGCGIIFGTAVLVVCFRKTADILEKNYELNPY